jgi:hypothetical protein
MPAPLLRCLIPVTSAAETSVGRRGPKGWLLPSCQPEGGDVAMLEVADGKLIIRMTGMDRVWSLKSELAIPIADVVGAEKAAEEAGEWWHGIRTGGTHIPGVISAGTFHSHGDRVFWDVHDPGKAIAIELRNWRYARLVLEVDDPDAAVETVRQAVGG